MKKSLPPIPTANSKNILYPSPPISPKTVYSNDDRPSASHLSAKSLFVERDDSSSEKEIVSVNKTPVDPMVIGANSTLHLPQNIVQNIPQTMPQNMPQNIPQNIAQNILKSPSNITYASDPSPNIATNQVIQPIIRHRIMPPTPVLSSSLSKRKHRTYIVISEMYKDAKRLCSAIEGEYHMHVTTSQFLSVMTGDEVVIVVCTPRSIFNHCKVMNSLIRSQNGKAVCVCVLPELNRRDIVDEKRKMMSMMNEDNIVFVTYDRRDTSEITTLDKFWREVDYIVGT